MNLLMIGSMCHDVSIHHDAHSFVPAHNNLSLAFCCGQLSGIVLASIANMVDASRQHDAAKQAHASEFV